MKEKKATYKTTNSYVTLNDLSTNTKNIWIVFHGMGYLSRYFLRPFIELNPNENYFIAPQAPSKYYLKDEFKYVGASWLTKENTQQEIQNLFSYIDAVADAENLLKNTELILLGFSQGVSIVTRWMASRKIQCKKLVMYAGSIPNELKAEDFDYLDYSKTEIHIIFGDKDEYLTAKRLKIEKEKAERVFQGNAVVTLFDGIHEIKPEILMGLV